MWGDSMDYKKILDELKESNKLTLLLDDIVLFDDEVNKDNIKRVEELCEYATNYVITQP